MTQAEKMAKARELAVESLNLPENAVQIGVGEYAFATDEGIVKVKVSAVKDAEYDLEQAKTDFEFDQNEKLTKAKQRKAESDAKKQADIAKKEKAKAEKSAKGE